MRSTKTSKNKFICYKPITRETCMEEVVTAFDKMGLPLCCCGSMNVTHVHLVKYREHRKVVYIGTET